MTRPNPIPNGHSPRRRRYESLRDQFAPRLLPEVRLRADEIIEECCWIPDIFESPIEELFCVAWNIAGRISGDDQFFYELFPQRSVEIGASRYRLDFSIYCKDRYEDIVIDKIAVEVDGHDFHERTKEQVERRNLRDRELQSAGWKIFHFAGSEVWREPLACVESVREFCQEECGRIYVSRRERQRDARDGGPVNVADS